MPRPRRGGVGEFPTQPERNGTLPIPDVKQVLGNCCEILQSRQVGGEGCAVLNYKLGRPDPSDPPTAVRDRRPSNPLHFFATRVMLCTLCYLWKRKGSSEIPKYKALKG